MQSLEEFDGRRVALSPDPWSLYAEIREKHAILWSEKRNCWYLFRHDDAVSILNDPRFGRDAHAPAVKRPPLPPVLDGVVAMGRRWMLLRDPPEHTRLRAPVSRTFTPRRVAMLRDGFLRDGVGRSLVSLELSHERSAT